jgi:16S rRNA processing protein RimM
MAKKEFLEAGRILNTHGVRGEVKIEAWTDEPQILADLDALYLDGRPLTVESARVHKGFVLAKLRGVDTVEAAMVLKGRVIFARRDDLPLSEGAFFLQDAIGCPVCGEDGTERGVLKDVLDYPAGRLFVVQGETEHLIPEQGGFIRSFDPEAGKLIVRLIEGM